MHSLFFGRLAGVILALAAAANAPAAPLSLTCEFNNRVLTVAGIEHNQPYCVIDGKNISVPSDAVWGISGDVRGNTAVLDGTPSYSIKRFDLPDVERAKQERPFRAVVSLSHLTALNGKPNKSLFLNKWPDGIPTRALGVFVWLLDGKIVSVAAKMLPSTKRPEFFHANHEFNLTLAEGAGHAVTLLWIDGSFVPVAARFTDATAQAAFLALSCDDDAAVLNALASGMKPSVADKDDRTLLHFAAEAGRITVVNALLAAHLKPDVNARKVSTALHWAIRTGRSAIVERLLAAGAEVDERMHSLTPLTEAIDAGHDEIALQLVRAKANVDSMSFGINPPISRAVDAGMAEVARALLARHAYYEFVNDQAPRVLITQSGRGHTACVQFLLDHKVKPDVDFRGLTALVAAAPSRDPALARALIAAGASANQPGVKGITPLMMAALNDAADSAAVLLDAGALVDAASADGWTPMHFATQGRSRDVVELLLARGAPPNARTSKGITPLDLALNLRAESVVHALAASGARLDIHGPNFNDYLETALAMDAAPLIQAAVADGWPSDAVLFGRWTSLRIAEICRANNCAEILRAAGAKPDAANPLDMARPSDLDRPLKLAGQMALVDPRDIDAIFPAAIVEFEIMIDAQGEVHIPRFVGKPDRAIATEALAAVIGWKFAPPTRGGQPVAVKVRVPVSFPSSRDRFRETFDVDVLPVIVKQDAPNFPPALRRATHGGEVRVRFIVNPEGRTEHFRVVSSAYPDLDIEAVRAVEKWVFKPGEFEGKPVYTRMEVPIMF